MWYFYIVIKKNKVSTIKDGIGENFVFFFLCLHVFYLELSRENISDYNH